MYFLYIYFKSTCLTFNYWEFSPWCRKIFPPLLAKFCSRGISIKFDVNWQLRHKLKNLLCSLFIQLHIAHIYLTFAVYIQREIFILALAQFVLVPGQRHFVVGWPWGSSGEMPAWKFKDKADSILKSIKEILEQTENCFSEIFYEQKHFNLCGKKLKNRYNLKNTFVSGTKPFMRRCVGIFCFKCFYCPAYLLDSEKSPYTFSFSRMLTESHAKF